MDDEILKDRTFQLYYFEKNAFPDFAVQSQCGGSHRRAPVAFDFRALRIEEDTLRPTVLKFKDQNFQDVATEWELANSAILKPGGLTPIVDDAGVVVAYMGNNDPIATYMRPIVDVDGNMVVELWEEPPLEPSLPFEVGLMLIGGFGTRGIVKGAAKKMFTAEGIVMRLKGALKGGLLKTVLRKRIAPRILPDLWKPFEYGPRSGTVPNFYGVIFTKENRVIYKVTNQVTKGCGTEAQRLAASQMRTQAIREAAEFAKLHKRSTFIMRIEQANKASRDAAEELLKKAGRPQQPTVISSGAAQPHVEWVLDTEMVLQNVR
jgi:hypothetical protein